MEDHGPQWVTNLVHRRRVNIGMGTTLVRWKGMPSLSLPLVKWSLVLSIHLQSHVTKSLFATKTNQMSIHTLYGWKQVHNFYFQFSVECTGKSYSRTTCNSNKWRNRGIRVKSLILHLKGSKEFVGKLRIQTWNVFKCFPELSQPLLMVIHAE